MTQNKEHTNFVYLGMSFPQLIVENALFGMHIFIIFKDSVADENRPLVYSTFLGLWYVLNVLKTEDSGLYRWDCLFSASKGFTY